MLNPYKTNLAKILYTRDEPSDSKFFRLAFVDKKVQEDFNFSPGQFVQISIPNFGEAPISICSDSEEKKYFEIAVRKAGDVTEALHKMKKDDKIGIRGPYGQGWPTGNMKKRNILMIAGGCGIEPLRPVILYVLKNKEDFGKVQLLYGCRSPRDMIFEPETKKWSKSLDVNITVDEKAGCEWKENVGVITTLFGKTKIAENPVVIMCGPPVMYKFVIQELEKLGIKKKDIYISLERNMDCSIGICQHCAVGPYYVCKDGPVFSLDRIKSYLENF